MFFKVSAVSWLKLLTNRSNGRHPTGESQRRSSVSYNRFKTWQFNGSLILAKDPHA
jgi:hypothetical protein